MSSKFEKSIKYVTDVLGNDAKFFDIKLVDIVQDDDYETILISIQPIPCEIDGVEINGDECVIEVTIDETGLHQMIFGEDTEMDVTPLNLYRYLYWNELGQ